MGGANGVNGVQQSSGLFGAIKDKAVSVKKEINCIFHPDSKDCPDVTAEYAAKAEGARSVTENSVLGKSLQNGLLNAKNHRNVLETGDVEDK